jgi:hypothetical protein
MTPEEMAALPVGAIVESVEIPEYRWIKVNADQWMEHLHPDFPEEGASAVSRYLNDVFIEEADEFKVVTE